MSVRAKMRVTRISAWHDGKVVSQKVIVLNAVNGTDADNAEWSKYTPSGEVSLTITNPEAFEQFENGKLYFVDFTPAEG